MAVIQLKKAAAREHATITLMRKHQIWAWQHPQKGVWSKFSARFARRQQPSIFLAPPLFKSCLRPCKANSNNNSDK